MSAARRRFPVRSRAACDPVCSNPESTSKTARTRPSVCPSARLRPRRAKGPGTGRRPTPNPHDLAIGRGLPRPHRQATARSCPNCRHRPWPFWGRNHWRTGIATFRPAPRGPFRRLRKIRKSRAVRSSIHHARSLARCKPPACRCRLATPCWVLPDCHLPFKNKSGTRPSC
ncbi:hypothetical protein D9M73_190670 [compost metagenome]